MKSSSNITKGGIIAALYVVLTLLTSAAGLSSGPVQLRISEALCILPCFTPAAIPGLFLGCLLSNLLTGGVVLDVLFGSLATLAGAIGTRLLRNKRFACVLPPVLVNTVVIPLVLKTAYGLEDAYLYLLLTVGAGEILSAGVLGLLLRKLIIRNPGIKTFIEK